MIPFLKSREKKILFPKYTEKCNCVSRVPNQKVLERRYAGLTENEDWFDGICSGLPTEEIKACILNSTNDDELQSTLFNLLGYNNISIISEIFQRKSELIAKWKPKEFPHVYGLKKATIPRFNQKVGLPSETIHENTGFYEEYHIPASTLSRPKQTLKKISDLNPNMQKCFEKYESLNLLQTIVYPVAVHSNANMLVCAPTGAGKTDVALLAIMRVIEAPKSDNFKIIYLAPMKALAAEITKKFSKKLAPLNVKVREFTGDMSLTKDEIRETNVIVSTPEKWDVITRKSLADTDLVQKTELLIIDEVHLLHEERGSVLESLVARTLREVEISQRMIRIVGLSATLPNFMDVAAFLRVNPYEGMFYFGENFRPIPLDQTFIGVKGKQRNQFQQLNENCFSKMMKSVKEGYQVMIFVHSRMNTIKTAKEMIRCVNAESSTAYFELDPDDKLYCHKQLKGVSSAEIKDLFRSGFSIHHAGLLRKDRDVVEELFAKGFIKVLCCTATLAWGVNLPCHTVIIKGTQVYDSNVGGFVNLGILDVLQIFGRAGRPQFEQSGHGIIITTHDKLMYYLNAMNSQVPIESTFLNHLADNLNAEVNLGTVSNLSEAVIWISYTYLFVRMRKNPMAYGIPYSEVQKDPMLTAILTEFMKKTAQFLHKLGLVFFRSESLKITELGRICSLFYIKCSTIDVFNDILNQFMGIQQILAAIAKSTEFESIKVRDEELSHLQKLKAKLLIPIKEPLTETTGKVNILLQSLISRIRLSSFSLMSDQNYVSQNASRIARALFEICMEKSWSLSASSALEICKSLEWKLWSNCNPWFNWESLTIYQMIFIA